MPGRIVILNGPPRAGKSSIAAALQRAEPTGWINWGVDSFNATLPDALLPGIGLRPGGERPDLEPLVHRLLATYLSTLVTFAENGFDVVADLGLHADYAVPFDAFAEARTRLAPLGALFVGVTCSLETIVARRRLAPRGPQDRDATEILPPVRRWHEAVHRGHDYDLLLDTDQLDPDEAAMRILQTLSSRPTKPL